MLIIRPARREDLDQLAKLAETASFGLTSLPKDRELLARRIGQSAFSFERPWDRPLGELFIFVMEDRENGRVVGTSCIMSKVGGFDPFYAYKLDISVHHSETLKIHREVQTLHLLTEHNGPCEIGGLFLDPEYRKHGAGRLLSLFRFLFMAEYPERFEPIVIAEMRGVLDDEGRSPFWEAVGRHFFDMDYPKADRLSVKDKRFIADLMPKFPIYVPMLPQAAQEVIAQVHPHTRPALKMLTDEGFTFSGMVDIFEGGPVISCTLDDIRIVRESVKAEVGEIVEEQLESSITVHREQSRLKPGERLQSSDFIVLKTDRDFRACIARLTAAANGRVTINRQTAESLQAKEGDKLRFGPLRPRPEQAGGKRSPGRR